MHLYIQIGFLVRIFASFHLKIELSNFFSIFQIVKAKSPPNGLVFQISDQYNKTSNVMHLYFHSAHEEHQIGFAQIIIQFVKNVACIVSPHCEVT